MEQVSMIGIDLAKNSFQLRGHPGPGVARNDGRRPHRDPHRRSRYRTGDRLGDRPGLLRLSLRSALLLLACARAGNQDQRRQEPPSKSPKAVNPVGQALRMAAMAARRSETFIGAKHRARLAQMDTPVAIKATAHDLACLVYLMVTEGQEYVEQGIDAYEKRRLSRKFAHLDRQARKLGLQLVPAPQHDKTQNQMPSTA